MNKIIFLGRKYWTIDILLSVQADVDTIYMSDVVCKDEELHILKYLFYLFILRFPHSQVVYDSPLVLVY